MNLKRLIFKEEPEPPVNVRVVRPDGTEIPISTVYAGIDPDGLHVWNSVTRITRTAEGPWGLRADSVPGRTRIAIEFTEDET